MAIQLTGTWEEIVKHSEEFRGRVVTIIVSSETETLIDPKVVDAFFDDAINVELQPPVQSGPDLFGDGIDEKLRQQGVRF